MKKIREILRLKYEAGLSHRAIAGACKVSNSTVAGVNVILPGGPADLKFVELLVTEENRHQRTFSVSELLILAHLWRERQVESQAITKIIQHG